jgi:beta-galactosidase beta subunit
MPARPKSEITPLRGKKMYVNVHGYKTLSAGSCEWESHQHTVDLQYCIGGGEIIQWTMDRGLLVPVGEYCDEKNTQRGLRGRIMRSGAYGISNVCDLYP